MGNSTSTAQAPARGNCRAKRGGATGTARVGAEFSSASAPADFNETVNTLGQSLYAKQEPRKFERGTDLHTQSNPLPMCHRPGVLVKLTAAA